MFNDDLVSQKYSIKEALCPIVGTSGILHYCRRISFKEVFLYCILTSTIKHLVKKVLDDYITIY